MTENAVLLAGCGYTCQRVARRLLQRGMTVIATTRQAEKLSWLQEAGAQVVEFDVLKPETLERLAKATPQDALVVHSVPTVGGPDGWFDPTPLLLGALAGRPRRVVYLSTTGVYGGQREVDEKTFPEARSDRERLRLQAERAVASGPWSWLILRPAAIYGPSRGVQEAMRIGEFRLLGDGSNFVSRIHVDDLAAHVESGLFSPLTGAWPVADQEPCSSREIASYCAGLLGLAMPPPASADELGETRRSDRRVDGSAVRSALGISLAYPSYRDGVPAALAADGRTTGPAGPGKPSSSA